MANLAVRPNRVAPIFDVGRRISRDELLARTRGRRVGFCMSAGFFGFYGHVGFLRAMHELDIRPIAVSGSSAGALTGAFLAGGMQPDEMVQRLPTVRKEQFWDPQSTVDIARALFTGGRGFMGFLKGELLREGLAKDLPAKTFESCRIPFASVSTNLTLRRRHVDTSGDIAEAITASAAFPIFFAPVKRATGDHWDGGIVDKAPLTALLALEKLDVIILQYLPPKTLRTPHALQFRQSWSGWNALDTAVDVLRHRDTLYQLAIATSRGVDVIITAPRLPRIGPSTMHRAERAIRAGTRNALAGNFRLVEAGSVVEV